MRLYIILYVYNTIALNLTSSDNHTVLNQIRSHLHDKANNEIAATNLLSNHQTETINNVDFNCESHAINDIFNGVVEGIALYVANQFRISGIICEILGGGLIFACKLICNLFTQSGKSVRNQALSFKSYYVCNLQNNDYIFKNLKWFPETRQFHILRQISIIIKGLPLIKDWYEMQQV